MDLAKFLDTGMTSGQKTVRKTKKNLRAKRKLAVGVGERISDQNTRQRPNGQVRVSSG